jgi:hypothetical protein
MKRDLYQRLWMNKKKAIPPHPLVWVSFYSSTPSGRGLFLFTQNLWYGLFSFIHNLWYKFLFIHPQPQVWVSFYSSTISCIGLILKRDLFQMLWMNKKRPMPEIVEE